MSRIKVGEARVADFFDWAKANVLREDTPWILVKTINGTHSWRRPSKPRGAPKRATKKPAKRKGAR